MVYSSSSFGPPAAEGYVAGDCFTLLAVLVLLQQKITLLCSWFTLLVVLVLLQRRVTLWGGRFYSASSSGPPSAEGYFAGG